MMIDKQQTILEKLQKLNPENVQEVLNFVEFLEHKEKINQDESISFYELTQDLERYALVCLQVFNS